MQKLNYFHVRFQGTDSCNDTPDNKGGITFACTVDKNNVCVGVAVCSPKDSFKKKTGREIATERLNKNPQILDKDKVEDFINSLHVKGLKYDVAERIKATLTAEDLSLPSLKELVIELSEFKI